MKKRTAKLEREDAVAFMRELLLDCQKRFNPAGVLICEYTMNAFTDGKHEGASKPKKRTRVKPEKGYRFTSLE